MAAAARLNEAVCATAELFHVMMKSRIAKERW
jgi:hypothetical protein